MNAIAQALMGEKAAKWLDRLVPMNNEPSDWDIFKDAFCKQYTILDEKTVACNKLKEAR